MSDNTATPSVHVYPAAEAQFHNLEGPFCLCSPRVEPGKCATLVIHNSLLDQELELREAVEALLELYQSLYPPGTISPDGAWRMGEDGLWWGRCSRLMVNEK